MNPIFQVDRELSIPLYQQLADAIRAAIKNGRLADGEQLPTIQELDLARGTIIRAYDVLEREGLVEKVQGRGTFVRCAPESERSRKEQAMAAIDGMLAQLQGLGFSPAEINIFLNLKLRERAEEEARVKLALVECCPESLNQMAKQLQDLPNAELHPYLLNRLVQYPYHLDSELDMILTTQTHAEELSRLLPVKKRVTPVALQLATEAMVSIVRLEPGDRVGIVCQSQSFAALLRRTCQHYAEEARVSEPLLTGQEENLADYLRGKQALLVSEDLEAHCTAEARELLRRFPGQIIRCVYELDRGSLLYLQEKCKRILKSKTI